MSIKFNKNTGLTVDDFVASSIIRFGGLRNYIQEKIWVDTFAIQGNLGIGRGIKNYLENQKSRLSKVNQIRILDIGPAIGALTAMLVLQELAKGGLISKAKVILLDVSERVIEKTQQLDFEFPEMLINPLFKTKILSKLRSSQGVISSSHQLPFRRESIDICTAGFLFHHLHDDIKKPTAQEMQRVVKAGGFIGIAEEWFDNYEDYAAMHKDDEVPLAYESIISYRKLRGMFPQLEVFESHNPIKRGKKANDNYYYFCGIKRGLGTGPRLVEMARVEPHTRA